ncbi:hypothetical protein [Haloplanus salilacus]|uniref:hypothetical protein n=1 Tax=Haloplanus salilacus TaxID=2949994 RepID=UPI0030CFEC01
MSGITLQDFVDASERDFTIPEEAQERLNEILRELNPALYGSEDGDGGQSGNVGPKVQAIDVISSSGSVYVFEADAFDPEDSASQLTYEWQVDGQVVGDDSARLEYPFQSEGDVDVTVTVTDTGGKSNDKTRTVSISLPAAEDRFSVDTWDLGSSGQTQSIKYGVSDADGDGDVLALRLSIYPGDGSSISRTTSTLTDQDQGAVASLDDEFLYLNGFGKYTATLEAMDLDLYDGPEVDENGDLPNGDNFTGEDAEEHGTFVTLRETTDNITD